MSCPPRKSAGCSLGALVLLVSSAAMAEAPAFNLQLFRPALDSYGYVTQNGAGMLGHLELSIGLVGSWAYRPLSLRLEAGQPGPEGSASRGARTFAVESLFTSQLQLTLGLWRRLEVGVSVPVQVVAGRRQLCDAATDECRGYESGMEESDLGFVRGGFSDLGLHAKGGVLQEGRYPVGLAVLLALYLPLPAWAGSDGAFLGEASVTLRPQVVLERTWLSSRRLRTAASLGALIRPGSTSFVDLGTPVTQMMFCAPADSPTAAAPCGTGLSRSAGSQLTYGVAAEYSLLSGRLRLLGELYGYADLAGNAEDHPLEGLGGVKLRLWDHAYFMAGAGGGLAGFSDAGKQTGGPQVRVFGGLIVEPDIKRPGGG